MRGLQRSGSRLKSKRDGCAFREFPEIAVSAYHLFYIILENAKQSERLRKGVS